MPWLFAHGLHLLLVVLGLVGRRDAPAPTAAQPARVVRRRPPAVPRARGTHRRAPLHRRGRTADLRPPSQRTSHDPARPGLLDLASSGRSSSVAAAGVHAAVFPHHLEESFLVGAFFLAVTLGQAGWACLVFLAASRERLVAGIVANLGLVVLWGVSRTVGLPFLGREAVGGWDLAAGAWELVLVAACLVGLRRSADDRGLVFGSIRARGVRPGRCSPESAWSS